MPTVSVSREALFKALNKSYSDEEFDELCFQYGLEVDDVVEEPDKGITYKIEVGANRYDLLCFEGIARALCVYLGKESLPNYHVVPASEPEKYKLIVKPSTAQVRPYVVGAVLRNIKFTQAVYDSFIDLQDKLHQNLARKRTLVAIGTHDLDTISGPFIYDAKPPQDISFVPLNQSQVIRADKLLEMYSHDSHLKEYVPIIKDKPVYPVITDQKGVVLSLPPIINGNHSKITLNTRNVFIECTATDRYKAQIVLDTLVCMFSGYCEKPYTAEPVQVEYPSGEKVQYPTLQYRQQEAAVSYCNVLTGVSETAESIAELLTSMSLSAKPQGQDKVMVEVERKSNIRLFSRISSVSRLQDTSVSRLQDTSMSVKMLWTLLVLCLAEVVCSARRADIEETAFEIPIEAETGDDASIEKPDCKVGFIRIAGNCYSFQQMMMSWSDAQLACENQEAQLASVLNDEQYNGLLTHINANFPGTYWTAGAIRSGSWVWTTTGKAMAEQWWGMNPGTAPNQCAYFCSNTLKYWNKQCDSQLRFICEEVEKTVPQLSKFSQRFQRKSWNRQYN